eukprot:4162839-Pleurochrysis_carterae.AAC.5
MAPAPPRRNGRHGVAFLPAAPQGSAGVLSSAVRVAHNSRRFSCSTLIWPPSPHAIHSAVTNKYKAEQEIRVSRIGQLCLLPSSS